MSKGTKKNKIIKIVAYVLILVIIAGLIGFFAYFTNGFTEEYQTFYVECNNKQVLSTASGFILNNDEPLKVDVCYALDSVNKDLTGYSVKVLPCADFDFTVDNESYSFLEENDLSGAFEIVKKEQSFTIKPHGGVRALLEELYPNKEIAFDSGQLKLNEPLIKIIVYSKDGSSSVTLLCNFQDQTYSGLTLNKEVILF